MNALQCNFKLGNDGFFFIFALHLIFLIWTFRAFLSFPFRGIPPVL